MKKFLSVIAACMVLFTSFSLLSFNTFAETDKALVLSAENQTEPTEERIRDYNLIVQFRQEQIEAGNRIFSTMCVVLNDSSVGSTSDGPLHNKIIIMFYTENEQEILPPLKAFMQENNIDENGIVYTINTVDMLVDTPREFRIVLNIILTFYLRENNYFAVIAPETDAEAENLVSLTFWLTPEEAETFDREAVQAGVRSVCEANSLDPALVKVIFETETGAAADGEALWETRTALEDFIAEKGYNVGVHFIHDTTLPEVYGDAHAMIELSFAQAPASDMNRDERISAEIGSMLQEKGLTAVPVTIISLADTAAPGESEATETTTTATETAATEAASATTTTAAAVTTTTAAATTAAGTTTAAPPKTGDRAETGMLAAGIASLLAAAACTKRRKE